MRSPILMDVSDSNSTHNYLRAFSEHGESPKSLKWISYKSVAKRYRQLVRDLNFENKTILDAGCGMGDLLPFIYAKSSNFDYLGVDIIPEFIDIAKKRYEGNAFKVADVFGKDFNQKFDVIVSSGIMNHNISDWLEVRKKMIVKLFDLANEVLAFNMAGALNPIPSDQKIAYANAKEILDFCATLTPKLILKTHYHPKDFTVVMFK